MHDTLYEIKLIYLFRCSWIFRVEAYRHAHTYTHTHTYIYIYIQNHCCDCVKYNSAITRLLFNYTPSYMADATVFKECNASLVAAPKWKSLSSSELQGKSFTMLPLLTTRNNYNPSFPQIICITTAVDYPPSAPQPEWLFHVNCC